MNTALARKVKDSEEAQESIAHAQAIADKLAPDCREWEWTGETIDAGKGATQGFNPPRCACGHPIRYLFPLVRERDGATVNIGSTCIKSTVPTLLASGAEGLAIRLQNALAAHKEALKEQARREKAAKAEGQIAEILEDWTALQKWYRAAKRAYGDAFMPHGIWVGMMGAERAMSRSAASTPGRTAASLRTRYQTEWDFAVSVSAALPHDGYSYPAPPVPAEKKLRAKIVKSHSRDRDHAAKSAERGGSLSSHYAAIVKREETILSLMGE